MTQVSAPQAPSLARVGRVEAVDLARGFALVGMMLVHLAAYWIDRDPPLGHILVGGRAAPLFAMLAGVSLMLVHDREPKGAGSWRATVIRAVLLIALGLALGSLHDMPVLIILAFYGLLIVVALPFRRLSTRSLLLLAVAWSVVAPVLVTWAKVEHSAVEAGQAELSDLKHPVDLVMELLVWGGYPAAVWFAYILVGLAIGRLDLRRTAVNCWLVVAGAGLVVATVAAGWALVRTGAVDDRYEMGWRQLFAESFWPFDPMRWNDLLQLGQHTSTPLNVLSSIGSAILVVGLCGLVVRVPWARLLLTPIRAAGAMTLTLYTIHVLWAWRLRVGFIADHPDELRPDRYDIWALQVVVLCLAAVLWQRFIGKGPLEWAVRRLSIWGSRTSTRA